MKMVRVSYLVRVEQLDGRLVACATHVHIDFAQDVVNQIKEIYGENLYEIEVKDVV